MTHPLTLIYFVGEELWSRGQGARGKACFGSLLEAWGRRGYHEAHVEVRGLLLKIASLLPSCGSQGVSPSQTWQLKHLHPRSHLASPAVTINSILNPVCSKTLASHQKWSPICSQLHLCLIIKLCVPFPLTLYYVLCGLWLLQPSFMSAPLKGSFELCCPGKKSKTEEVGGKT